MNSARTAQNLATIASKKNLPIGIADPSKLMSISSSGIDLCLLASIDPVLFVEIRFGQFLPDKEDRLEDPSAIGS